MLPDHTLVLHGGCNCRAILYKVQVPVRPERPLSPFADGQVPFPLVATDHCNDCRRATGSILPIWICVPPSLMACQSYLVTAHFPSAFSQRSSTFCYTLDSDSQTVEINHHTSTEGLVQAEGSSAATPVLFSAHAKSDKRWVNLRAVSTLFFFILIYFLFLYLIFFIRYRTMMGTRQLSISIERLPVRLMSDISSSDWIPQMQESSLPSAIGIQVIEKGIQDKDIVEVIIIIIISIYVPRSIQVASTIRVTIMPLSILSIYYCPVKRRENTSYLTTRLYTRIEYLNSTEITF